CGLCVPEEQTLPLTIPDSAPPADADADLSLSDHEARYGEQRDTQAESRTPPAEAPVTEPDAAAEPASAETEERDEKGRFKPKKHRAASQEATPADVPRIQQLTARLRAAEAERDALRLAQPPSMSAGLQPSAVPQALA